MNEYPEQPDEQWQPQEDHEQPTRRVERVDPGWDDPQAADESGLPDDPNLDPDDAAAQGFSNLLDRLEADEPDPEATRVSALPDAPPDYYPADDYPADDPPDDFYSGEESVADDDWTDDPAADYGGYATGETGEYPAPDWEAYNAAPPPETPPHGTLPEPDELNLEDMPLREVRRDEIPPRTYDSQPYTSAQLSPPPPLYGGMTGDSAGQRPASSRPPRKRRRTARERRASGFYFPWWTLLLLLGGVAAVAVLGILGLSALGGQFAPGGETPVVIVITSTPTPGPTDLPTNTPFPTTGASPTSTPVTLGGSPTPGISAITPAPESLELQVGATVAITGVEAAGLNVREGAGTGFPVLFIAPEGSLFEVISGPEEANDFTWWQLRGVDDPTQTGWAVAEFLSVQTGQSGAGTGSSGQGSPAIETVQAGGEAG